MKFKIFLLAIILLNLPVSVEAQTFQKDLVFRTGKDTTFEQGDSFFIMVQVWDSLSADTLIRTGWLPCLPDTQFIYKANLPFKSTVFGWQGRERKKTIGGLERFSEWCSPFHFRYRIVSPPSGCVCISPANGSVIEVIK